MEGSQVIDKYDKAKIEEPNPILPDFLDTIYGGYLLASKLSYQKVFVSQLSLEEQTEENDRKVYRIRNKDLFATFGENCEYMNFIHLVSKAAITVLANAEIDNQNHTYIDIIGTISQVRTAEHLILNKILTTYDGLIFPVILMPPIIHEEQVTIPLDKVGPFIGPNSSNLTKLEMESRTWMMIDCGPPGSSEMDRVVKLYGPKENVTNALTLVQSEIHKIQLDEAAQMEKYGKAKIEDPNQVLPKDLKKVNTDSSTGEIYYWKFFEDDRNKTKKLAEAVAAGEQPEGKMHRIRDKELYKALGNKYDHFEHIHKVSKCTIALLSDAECNACGQTLILLMGTVNQITTAEHLILDKILQTYGPTFPVILMPPTIGEHQMKLPVEKIDRLMGDSRKDIMAMEVLTGAWIQFDKGPDCSAMERRLHIYGPRPQVVKALSLVTSVMYEPGESVEAQREVKILFNQLTMDEMESCNKDRFREELDKLQKEVDEEEAASGSSSGQTEEHMQDEEKQQEEAELAAAEQLKRLKLSVRKQHEDGEPS